MHENEYNGPSSRQRRLLPLVFSFAGSIHIFLCFLLLGKLGKDIKFLLLSHFTGHEATAQETMLKHIYKENVHDTIAMKQSLWWMRRTLGWRAARVRQVSHRPWWGAMSTSTYIFIHRHFFHGIHKKNPHHILCYCSNLKDQKHPTGPNKKPISKFGSSRSMTDATSPTALDFSDDPWST